jgi:hypothetical protein
MMSDKEQTQEMGEKPVTEPKDAAKRSAKAAKESEAAATPWQLSDGTPTNPKTNQPISDFLPVASEELQSAVDLANQNLAFVQSNAAANVVDRIGAAEQRKVDEQEHAEAQLQQVEQSTEQMMKDMPFMPPDLYFARANARVRAEAAMNTQRETIVGGMFIVNGELVNANGDLIDESGKVLAKRS